MTVADLRRRSIERFKPAVRGLLAKYHRHFETGSPGPSLAKLDKKDLIDYIFARCTPRPASFADLGGVWGVHGEYTFYALENHKPEQAYLADNMLTDEVLRKADGHPQLELIRGNFGTDSVAARIRGVDAVLLFDVLLHQVGPDWDEVLDKHAIAAKYLVIYNQQWTGEKTVRLLDLGRDEYFRNTPHDPTNPALQALFENTHELHPRHQRPWRDISDVWQWGITDADLTAKVEALGFHLQYYKNCGVFGRLPNFENHAFVFKRTDLPT